MSGGRQSFPLRAIAGVCFCFTKCFSSSMTQSLECLRKMPTNGNLQQQKTIPRSFTDLSLASTCDTDLSTSCGSESGEVEIVSCVKNTFLEFHEDWLPLEEVSLHLRRVKSAPGSIAMCDAINFEAPQILITSSVGTKKEPVVQPKQGQAFNHPGQQESRLLELGTPELPTVGSAAHSARLCKPCSFMWKESGCVNGTACTFCHLCVAGERRHRRKNLRTVRGKEKEKKALRRVAEENNDASAVAEAELTNW